MCEKLAQLKDIYSEEFLVEFAQKVKSVYNDFDENHFVQDILNDDWFSLKLRERMQKISTELGRYLPQSYPKALEVLDLIVDDCVGFAYLFFPDFVSLHGLEEKYFELSMEALKRYTPMSSSEFAIRPFILKNPERVMEKLILWAKDENEHVRRLSSEGCRPRLPWGMSLPIYKTNPTPVLKILNILKKDPSLYVRKSVANNLNDISKDNPQLVIQTAKQWFGENKDTDWIVRHGCRSLVKQSVPEIMSLFDYASQESLVASGKIITDKKTIDLGEKIELQYAVNIESLEPVKLRIEYGIDFVKANGSTSRKKFLLSDKTVDAMSKLNGRRTHDWSNLTTRKHYAGSHKITLLVNGIEVSATEINLKTEKAGK